MSFFCFDVVRWLRFILSLGFLVFLVDFVLGQFDNVFSPSFPSTCCSCCNCCLTVVRRTDWRLARAIKAQSPPIICHAPPRVAVRRWEVIRHADGRGWEKMENVEFRNFPSITSRKSYCISKIIIFETVSRWLTCDYSSRNNTMSHLLPAVIWWPSSRCICRCLLIGGKLNSIKFLWRYLMSWIILNDT